MEWRDDIEAHDAILEALRLHHVGDISRSEMIGRLVALCEGRYRAGLEDAAKVCETVTDIVGGKNSVAMSLATRIRALADK